MAIDKKSIVDNIVKEVRCRPVVLPPVNGHQSGYCGEYNPQEAQRLLTEAGFPAARTSTVRFSTTRLIAIVALPSHSQDWKKNLGINVSLNLEWGTYLDTLRIGDYMVSIGWIGDYAIPIHSWTWVTIAQ